MLEQERKKPGCRHATSIDDDYNLRWRAISDDASLPLALLSLSLGCWTSQVGLIICGIPAVSNNGGQAVAGLMELKLTSTSACTLLGLVYPIHDCQTQHTNM